MNRSNQEWASAFEFEYSMLKELLKVQRLITTIELRMDQLQTPPDSVLRKELVLLKQYRDDFYKRIASPFDTSGS